MNMDILQHHEPFDFESFFKSQQNAYIGIDYQDYETLLADAIEVHSFIGTSEADNRVETALCNVFSDSKNIVDKASAVLIQFLRSPNADKPLRTDEMSSVNEMMSKFPKECNVVWGLSNDDTLGNAVKVMLLIAVKE